MKKIEYDYDSMIEAVNLLNKLSVCGINQARLIARLGDILDSGKIIEKEETSNGVYPEEVCEDKLEK